MKGHFKKNASIYIYIYPLLEVHGTQVTNQGLNQSPCLGSIAQPSIKMWDENEHT